MLLNQANKFIDVNAQRILLIALIAAGYFLLAKISFIFDFNHSGFAPLWLPAGFALAMVFMKGEYIAVGVFIGALFAHAGVFIGAGEPRWALSASLAFVNTLQALAGCAVLNHFLKKPYPLFKVSDVFVFVFGASLAALIGAVMGTAFSCAYQVAPWEFYNSILFNWWWAEFAGIVTIAPLVWISYKVPFKPGTERQQWETLGWVIAVALIAFLVFGGKTKLSQMNLSSTFLLLPLVVWYTYRLGHWAAMTSVGIIVIASVWGTANGFGPFIGEDQNATMLLLRFFNAVVALTALTLAAALFERQHAQEELERSHQRFKALIENSLDAINLLSAEGIILYSSDSVRRLTGYTADENVGRNIFELIYPDDQAAIQQTFARVLSRPWEIVHSQCRLILKNGSVRWFEGSGQNLLADPLMKAIVLNFRDITERKMMEEILNMDKRGLESLVNERTEALALTREELKQANRLADIGTLAATVAHELRNPLGVIQIAAHNLKKKNKDLQNDHHLENIQRKVWEGNQIIDNLLSYSRIRMPSFGTVNVREILEECITHAQERFAAQKTSVLHLYAPQQVPIIEADSNQLREIFANVLENAFQATNGLANGEIRVGVAVDGDFITFTFSDNGCGVDPQDLKKVFHPFFTRKTKGTGLGLAICSEIVHLHHGHIDMTSKKGFGSSVLITLPMKQPASVLK